MVRLKAVVTDSQALTAEMLFDVGILSQYLSHRPMRLLPVAANREVDESSPARFISPTGLDSNTGLTEGSPVKTLAKAATILSPGDTLYCMDGTYYLEEWGTIVQFLKNGASLLSTVTVRAYPGALPRFNFGYRRMHEDPDTAWEPVPPSEGGVEGEYRTLHTYPHGERKVAGNFGDTMIPLFRYIKSEDLRSDNEFDILVDGMSVYANAEVYVPGLYCGPGAHWNGVDQKFYCRLAHTHIPALDTEDYLGHGAGFSHNYTGVEDPREVPLVLTKAASELRLRGSYTRFQDIVVEGCYRLELGGDTDTEVVGDNITYYQGLYGIGMVVKGLLARTNNCKFRGYDAPWSNRFADKNRTAHATLIQINAQKYFSDRTQYTDSHNGVTFGSGVLEAEFKRCDIENMNDDIMLAPARHASRKIRILQSYLAGATSYIAFTGGGQGVLSPDDVGLYIARSVFDLRRRIYSKAPSIDDQGDLDIFRHGLLTNEHSASIRPNVFKYHNDVILPNDNNQDWYFARWADDFQEAKFKVWNNILVQFQGVPDQDVRAIANGEFSSFNNLQWAYNGVSVGSRPGDIHQDPDFVDISEDWLEGTDLHLQSTSPARLAGVQIPALWPDPLRALDENVSTPTLGAIPYGVAVKTYGSDAEV